MERKARNIAKTRCTGGTRGLLAATWGAPLAQVTENGLSTTPFDMFDFGAGMMSPPASLGTFAARFAYYLLDTSKDAVGHKVPNSVPSRSDRGVQP